MAVHTAGSLLNFNPHVHGIALDGGTAKDAQFIQLENIDTEDLISRVRDKVFSLLLERSLISQ